MACGSRWGKRIFSKFRVESLELRVSLEVYSSKYEVFEGGLGVLQLFVLAEVVNRRLKYEV